MSEHLPECPGYPYTDDPSECICDRLRACEARVRWDTSNTLTAAHLQSEREWADLSRDNFDAGYAAGVQAARDVVAAVEMGGEHFWSVGFRDGITIALDALDALDALRDTS